MSEQIIDLMVEGGKATSGPPLGPAAGPSGIPIGDIVNSINEKTKDFKNMKVPVKVTLNSEEKTFKIKIGTPPVSELIKKELNIKKGSSTPGKDPVGDIRIEQLIKVANMKKDDLAGVTKKARVKTVLGSCIPLGLIAEGMHPRELSKLIDNGRYDKKIDSNKTELTEEELKEIEEENKKLKEEIEKHRETFIRTAKEIMGQMKGKSNTEIRKKMEEKEIPHEIIEELCPRETADADNKDKKGEK